MTKTVGVVLCACGALTLSAAMFGGRALAQDRPGVVMQPRVLIENRGRNEAIPVTLAEDTGVRVLGTATVALVPNTVVPARLVMQPWEYRTVTIRAGQDMASALASVGTQGWEAIAVQSVDGSGTNVLLKRPQ